ncbi:MAG: flagellar motor switch phosphatase FliY [Deltaproteobacteria bacterium]
MNDGILSQEEIDALLKVQDNTDQPSTGGGSTTELSDFEKDTLGEIGNISMGTAATTLSTLLRKKVSITTPDVAIISTAQLQDDYPMPYVVAEVEYTVGLAGTNVLVIKEEDACIIADLMMGGDGTGVQITLDDIKLSAVGEAMNQMMGSATTSLSSMFNQRIDIAPPRLTLMDFGRERLTLASAYNELVRIQFKMEIEDLINSEIMQIIPLEAVKNMIDILMGNTVEESNVEGIMAAPAPPQAAAPPPPPPRMDPVPQYQEPPVQASYPAPDMWTQAAYNDIPSGVKKGQQYVQPAQFAPLREVEYMNTPQNIGLIMDVPLDIAVELGKTKKTIKDILELHQGAIVQLDKLAGEPVDMLVNGKLIAKGEVVVIDENYGIRITAIISPMDRMSKLQ